MTVYAALLAGLLFSTPAASQSLGGIALHDGRDRVRAVMPNGRELRVGNQSDPRLTMTNDGEQTVWLCEGVVSQVREQSLGRLNDFARAVAASERVYGPTTLRSSYVSHRGEELSTLEASWAVDGVIFKIGVIDLGGESGTEIFKSFTDPDLCPSSNTSSD